ncbi:MAG: hypothetical protein GY904_07490 [Planctomycetaceae bacterium]|nr:hypothetical protein [Planctomycetaceae bacterium]
MRRNRRDQYSRKNAKSRRRLRIESLESRRVLASLVVTTNLDVVDAQDGELSLREAIEQANSIPGRDKISFDSARFAEPARIDLALGQLQATDSVSIEGTGKDRLTIDAGGASRVVEFLSMDGDLSLSGITLTGGQTVGQDINTNQSGGGIRFSSGGTLTLDQVDLLAHRTQGRGARGGGLFAAHGNVLIRQSSIAGNLTEGGDSPGGALFVADGSLTIIDSHVTGNRTAGIGSRGGAIYSSGTEVSIVSSTISTNQTDQGQADGGGIWSSASLSLHRSKMLRNQTLGTDSDGGALFSTGSVTLADSDLSHNSTSGIGASGGAMAVDTADISIVNSSITGNTTAERFSYGGGLFAIRSGVTIQNSTISTNHAQGTESDGGGLAIFFGSLELDSCTVTENESAGQGGGVFIFDSVGRGPKISNSIVAGNQDDGVAPDLFVSAGAPPFTLVASLIGDNTGTSLIESQTPDFGGNLVGAQSGLGVIAPGLGALRLVGLTRVHPLLPGSPAINAGDNEMSLGRVADQRGRPFDRIVASSIDMGAFEAQAIDPSKFVVNTLADEVNFDNSETSLREAIIVANGDPGSDLVTFASAIFDPAARIALNGSLLVTDALSIEAPADRSVTLAAVGQTRVIDVALEAEDLTIERLVIRDGRTSGADASGAGIRFASRGHLTLTDSEILDNHTSGNFAGGGGIDASIGTVTLNRSLVAGNSTRGDFAGGGGIRARQLEANDSSIANNQTSGLRSHGGGIEVSNRSGLALQMDRVTASGNLAAGSQSDGGAAAVLSGQSAIVSTTVSGNSAEGRGGGLFWSHLSEESETVDTHRLLASTITNNHSEGAGGGLSATISVGGNADISSNLIAENTSSASNPDLYLNPGSGQLLFLGNLLGDNAGTTLPDTPNGDNNGNLIGSSLGSGVIDPRLTPLANRGGRTASHALFTDSPAIDAGRVDLLTELTTDQRGEQFVRDFGNGPDIGSFETQILDPRFFTVNTVADELNHNSAHISLREAIVFAAASEGAEVIHFDPIIFATPQTIQLSRGALRIHDSLQIVGPSNERLTLDGQSLDRVLDIAGPEVDVTLDRLTITGGQTSDGPGGGIRFASNGTLSIKDVTLASNKTTGMNGGGGGLFVDGGRLEFNQGLVANNVTEGKDAGGGGILIRSANAVIIDSQIRNNQTFGDRAVGGGIKTFQTELKLQGSVVQSNQTAGSESNGAGIASLEGTLLLFNSQVSQNRTTGDASGGGLIAEQATVEIYSSAITGNQTQQSTAGGGGLMITRGVLDLTNSTISGNVALGNDALGGGILSNDGHLQITNSTITANAADGGGGGIAAFHAESPMPDPDNSRVANSIVAANQGPSQSPDLLTEFSTPAGLSFRFSLIGDRLGSSLLESQQPDNNGNRIGSSVGGGMIDPLLHPLSDNGGSFPTHLPMTGSPAIDSGEDPLAVSSNGSALKFDGRGEPLERRFGTVDQGAVEVQPPRAPVIQWNRPANIFAGTPLGANQLNASTNTAGEFVYTPPLGTVLPLGDDQELTVRFVPENTTVFSSVNATVPISIVDQSDRGDAPDHYATQHADDGPRHVIGTLFMGTTVDAETEGSTSPDASGDGEDEDGVTFITSLVVDPTQPTVATVSVVASTRGGKLDAWIDFDGNGLFDHNAEHLSGGQSLPLASGENRISFTVPTDASPGNTFARFRLSSAGGLLPTGAAADGEVEDHAVTLLDGRTKPSVGVGLPLGQTTLRRTGNELIIGRSNRDFFRASLDSVSHLRFEGNAGSNVLIIDSAGGVPIPDHGYSFDGGQGVNTIRLVGQGLSLNVTAGSDIELANIDVIDLTDLAASTFRVDSAAAREIDPNGNGLIVVGSLNDRLEIADRRQWRMAAPTGIAGMFFNVVRLPDTFIQTDFSRLWQNVAQSSDINNDGDLTAADALRIINELSRHAFSDPTSGDLFDPAIVSMWPNTYYDQNGDGKVTALDALRVINDLARLDFAAGEQIVPADFTPETYSTSAAYDLEFATDEEDWRIGTLF